MKFYKKVLLTLSSAGIMTACSNKEDNAKTLHQVKAVVVQLAYTSDIGKFYGAYCDIDGDGQIDRLVYITRNNFDTYYQSLEKTIHIGDTIKYYTATPDKLYVRMRHLGNFPDSINNRSIDQIADSLKYQHKLAKLRQKAKVH